MVNHMLSKVWNEITDYFPNFNGCAVDVSEWLSELIHVHVIIYTFWNLRQSMLVHTSMTWWRHQMETFSALLAICAGNSPVSGEFPAQRTVTRSFDVFFDLRLHKWLSKQSWGWWFETLSRPLWRHRNGLAMNANITCHDSRVQKVFSKLNIWTRITDLYLSRK